ncbi:MAG TPA: SDR family NAD(P)-dependent oxidoreductase, partial [Polyangiaceae bacterium]|nr:SDR family NAD(P)-dependent oxidoreductase [Polyangiaceae bacterium]
MSQKSAETPVVLVTGASRGLGRGIARALAREGMSVAVHFASNRAAADETVAECQKSAINAGQRFVAVGGNIGAAADRAR